MTDALMTIGLKFLIDIVVISILVRGIYYTFKKDQEFAFAFLTLNVIIFFICYVMQTAEISMGVAFGLFAIFGILRYRTTTIPIKDMSYLFTSIAIALITAIGKDLTEIIVMNALILLAVVIMEKLWFQQNEQYKSIQYEKINLIQENNLEEILSDLRKRTQLDVTRFEIKSMNFLNDTAQLKVYFKP
jgi:uncharacterized membrane protein